MAWEHGNDKKCEHVRKYSYISQKWASLHSWARWRHWKVRRPRCISSPWEKLLQKRHLQILHDIHQREWYMIQGSLVFSFDISSLVLFDKNWFLIDLSILYTHPLESWSIHPFVFPINNFLANYFFAPRESPRQRVDEDHCLATTRRRVGRRTGPRMKRWSNSCHHLSPPLKPTECGGSSMRVFTLRLRCVLWRVGSKCNGDCDTWHHTNRFGGVKDQFWQHWHSLTWKLAKMARQQACMTMFPWARLVALWAKWAKTWERLTTELTNTGCRFIEFTAG